MSPEERQLLNELFARVGQAASTPRDPEAEALIRDELARHPYAAYYLAQAVILQEKGLEASAARIGQLEAQVKDLQQGATAQQHEQGQQGGFLSGLSSLFGGNPQGQSAPPQQPPAGPWGRSGPQAPAYDGGYTRGAPQPGPWSQPPQPSYAAPQQPSRGGGFLSGAMTTAAGVAGGMLMADAVRSLFAPHFGAGGLFGAGGVAGAPVVEENVVNNFFDNGNQPGQSNDWQNGNDTEQSALADMSNATQNTDGDDYDDSSYDDGGFDDSNYA
ncbi:hypothetical protein SAMN05421890_3334 [Ensifer adhaerens]|nr:hypothetical protein SAMN05421890_3334 [Ensifer adhaerens]